MCFLLLTECGRLKPTPKRMAQTLRSRCLHLPTAPVYLRPAERACTGNRTPLGVSGKLLGGVTGSTCGQRDRNTWKSSPGDEAAAWDRLDRVEKTGIRSGGKPRF